VPFENCIAKVYTASSVWQNAPPLSGIYGLSNSRGWLFVGETDDIRGSLLELLESAGGAAIRKGATGFSFELRAPGDRAQRRDQLLVELRPQHARLDSRGNDSRNNDSGNEARGRRN
jgi:hypothetical protein